MSRKKGTRQHPETRKWGETNHEGILPWGLTPDAHDKKLKKKRNKGILEVIGSDGPETIEQTLDEKLVPNRTVADGKRPPRQAMNLGTRLYISPTIEEEIDKAGYVARLCYDYEDNIEQYLENWWEFHLDANGEKITRRAGGGGHMILMKLPKDLFSEDQRLQSIKRRAKYNNSNLLAAGFSAPNGDVLREVPG